MRVHFNRYTKGLTRWGIFTNLFDPDDRWVGDTRGLPFGLWYFHIHTPLVQIQFYSTTD